MSRMFDLSNYAVENVSDEEKQKYVGNMRETGTYRGYKLRKFWVGDFDDSSLGPDSPFTSTSSVAFAIKSNNITVFTHFCAFEECVSTIFNSQ
jgi:hypothetical protein